MSDLLTDEEFMGSASPTPIKLLNDDEFMGIDAPDKSVPFGSVARGFNRLQQTGNVLLRETGVISDESAAKAIARDQADIAKYPTSPTVKQGLKEIAGAEGWGDTIWTILKNPSTVASIVGESLPVSAAAQVAGTLGGVGGSFAGPGGTTAGLAGGTFAASFATEYSSTILDTMQAAGVDLADPKAVGRAFADDNLMAEARARGVKRGIPVGAFDALSFGIAGKFAKAIEGGAETVSTLRRSLAEAAEVGAQGAAGAGGEAGAQIADKGKIVSASDVLLEAAGEIAASPVEIAIGQTRHSEQPSAKAGASVAEGAAAPTVTEGAGVSPPPSASSRDTRPDSPRLTAADRASPLPNDLIDDGKKIFEEALGKKAIDVPTSDIATPSMRAEAERRAAEIATPAGQPAPPAIDHTIEGTLTPAEAQAAPTGLPARLLTDAEFMGSAVDEAAHAAATSPQNALPEPTQAMKEAGNYKAGHTTVGGLDVSIENPQGSTRSGVDPNGKPWTQEMQSHYGYIRGTVGKDKDHIDVFVKPGTPSEMADDAPVFVVDQVKPDGKLDEHKVMMGFADQAEADAGYHANYQKGWKGAGAITPTTLGEFKGWLANGDTTKPFGPAQPAAYSPAQTAAPRIAETSNPVAEPAAQTALKQKIKAKRERAPIDLVQFLASEGGIADHKGEVASLGMKSHFVPGLGKLMRAGGMDLDRAREKAEEAGYIGKAGDYQTTTVADLLDALDKNVRGQRVYAREDAGRAENRAAEKAVKTDSEEQARQDDFDQMVKEHDLKPDEIAEMDRAVKAGRWASEAIDDIMERRAIAFGSKTRKSRTQKEPDLDDIPFDLGPEDATGQGAPDESRGRQGDDTGGSNRSAPPREEPSDNQRAARAEEGGKGESELSAEDRNLLSVFPEGYRFIEGRGQLGRGHWGVASPEAPNTLIWNLHPTKAEAARTALSHMNSQANRQAEREAQDKWEKALAVRLLAGEEPTDSAIQKLGLKPKAGFEWLSPVVQRLFGVSKMRVRQSMGDSLKRGHSMGGVEFWVADAKKALMNAAAWVNAQSAPTVEPGAEGKPQTVLPGAERISEKKQAQREADKPMRPKVPQKDAGELFDEQARSEKQGEMFSLRRDITDTPAFKKWFGNSKVTNDDGSPQVVYHNTHREFDTFDRMSAVTLGNWEVSFNQLGLWFSSRASNEEGQGKAGSASAYGPKQLAVYLKMEKPFVIHGHADRALQPAGGDAAWNKFWKLWTKLTDEASSPAVSKSGFAVREPTRTARRDPEPMRQWLKANGYDGIILRNTFADTPSSITTPQDFFIVLEPEQIKSATGNSGAFDPANPSIMAKARPATIQPTDAFRDQAQAIGKRLRAELDRLGLKDIGLRISETLGLIVDGKMNAADGSYFQKLIQIALDAENPDATLDHEALHALRDLNLFGKDEWAILERKSRKEWRDRYDIAGAYGAFPEWVQVEEGIAHAYAAWKAGTQTDGIIAKSFKKITAILKAIARAFGKDFRTAEDVFASVASGEVGGRARSGAQMTDQEMAQAAWHGTPHDFDEFKSDKIGTGEGAQAFGYGLYFAGKKEIAQHYRDRLSAPEQHKALKIDGKVTFNPQDFEDAQDRRGFLELHVRMAYAPIEGFQASVRGILDRSIKNVQDALDQGQTFSGDKSRDEYSLEQMQAARRFLDRHTVEIQPPVKPGRLFKVDLPEDNELMLWDAPLSEQPNGVQTALRSMVDAVKKPNVFSREPEKTFREITRDVLSGKDWGSKTGSDLYGLLKGRLGSDKAASEAFRAAGIPGHRYLDQGSRNPKALADARGSLSMWEAALRKTPDDAYIKGEVEARRAEVAELEKGISYNYVIYDDSRVKVQEKFALRRAAAAPAPAQRRTTPPISILPNISTVASSVSTRIMNAIKGGPGKNDGETLGDYSMRKIVDYLHPLREMIDSVGPIADRVNAYLEARLALDSAVASIQDMHGKFVTPAVEALTQAGASLDELHQYLYALHAEERNRVVGLRNEPGSDFFRAVTDFNTVGASGWSTNHARQVLRQLRVDPTKFAGIQQAGRLVRQMLDENLLAQKNAGLISDASYTSLSQQWQNYVPLQAEDGIDENGDFTMPGRGRGFDVRGKEFKGATGRFTEAENIPAWAISASERSKLRQAKNRVGKSILRFINQYDPMGTNLAEVYWSDTPAGGFGNIQKAPPVYKRELDASGKVVNKTVPYSTIAPDMYAAKVAGKTFYIKFADEKVGQALKNMNAVQMNFLFRLSRKITNFQSLVNTRINPAFTPTNFFRDVTTGAIHLLDEGFSGRETAKILGNIPTAWGALWRSAKGRPGTGPMDTALAELTKAGGRLIFEQQKTVEESIKSLHSQMKAAAAGKTSPQALWQGLVRLVGDINDTVEMGIRLSSYVAARDKGKTVKQAAFMIRDLTVDFRKHGEVGPTGNALFTFFNASVQGNFNVASRLLGSRKVQAAAATIALSGFMMDMLNRSLAGDDDDGENLYEKMLRNEPWKFERQMVIFYGPGKGSYFTIPLPYGYNAIYHMGVQTSAAANGDVTPFEAISNTMRVAVDAFNPMGGGGGWVNMFAPTVLDPFIEIDRNKNFADIPIYPTTYPGDTTPDSQQSFGKTPDVFKWAAEAANAATGGNKIEPGAVDIHPDTIEHMWDFVSGGLGRFFGQVADPLVKAGTGRSEDIAVEKLPFVRSFYGEQGDDNKRSEYYNKREAVQTAKSRLSDYKAAGDAGETQDFIERNKVDVESIGAFDAAEKRLRKIRKQRRRLEAEGGNEDQLKALDEAERKTMGVARLAYARNAARQR